MCVKVSPEMDPREAAASWLQNFNSVRRQPARSPVRDQGTFVADILTSWHPWVNSGLTKSISKAGKKVLLFFGFSWCTLKQQISHVQSIFESRHFCNFLDLIALRLIGANIHETGVSEEKSGRKLLGLQAVVHLNFQSDPVFREAGLWGAPEGRGGLLYKVWNARQRWSSLHAGAGASFHGATLTLFHYF